VIGAILVDHRTKQDGDEVPIDSAVAKTTGYIVSRITAGTPLVTGFKDVADDNYSTVVTFGEGGHSRFNGTRADPTFDNHQVPVTAVAYRQEGMETAPQSHSGEQDAK